MSSVSPRPRTICIVVGEESGDLLGSELILALKGRLGDTVTYCGVGGERTYCVVKLHCGDIISAFQCARGAAVAGRGAAPRAIFLRFHLAKSNTR